MFDTSFEMDHVYAVAAECKGICGLVRRGATRRRARAICVASENLEQAWNYEFRGSTLIEYCGNKGSHGGIIAADIFLRRWQRRREARLKCIRRNWFRLSCAMPTQPSWVINSEILELAKQCIAADDPQSCADEFGRQLVARGWEQADVDEVIKDGLNIVARLRSRSPEDQIGSPACMTGLTANRALVRTSRTPVSRGGERRERAGE